MTDQQSALEILKTKSPADRLRAARRLATEGNASMLQELRRLRLSEPDSWVRSALDGTIRTLAMGGAANETGQTWITVPADRGLEDVRAQAIQSVSQTLVHEIRTLLNRIALKAAADIEDFTKSDTAKAVQRLREFLRTMEKLQEAASAPITEEFDLRDLILETIRAAGHHDEQVVVTRAEPAIARGAPDLLAVALRNIVNNAVEASTESRGRVIVNCAVTDEDAWVVILDEGVGLPPHADRVWEPGRTTKSKDEHFGWGLSIAQRAVHSFGGSVKLTPRETGGTACEIRWSTKGTTRDGIENSDC